MKLIFEGVGAAGETSYQSNMLLEVNTPSGPLHNAKVKRLQIDAGDDLRHALREVVKLSYLDLDAVYISHLHGDHIHGLEYLALSTYFNPKAKTLPLYINERLAVQLWENAMRAGCGTIQDKITTLDTFFDVRKLGKNEIFNFAGHDFRPVQTIHYMDGYEIVPSYGLLWTGDTGKKVFLTTDTQFCPHQIRSFYDSSDIIFHDCETASFKSGIHAHYSDLLTLPEATKAKMWLYHYQDGKKPDAKADGFAGFVEQGQSFEL